MLRSAVFVSINSNHVTHTHTHTSHPAVFVLRWSLVCVFRHAGEVDVHAYSLVRYGRAARSVFICKSRTPADTAVHEKTVGQRVEPQTPDVHFSHVTLNITEQFKRLLLLFFFDQVLESAAGSRISAAVNSTPCRPSNTPSCLSMSWFFSPSLDSAWQVCGYFSSLHTGRSG